MATTLEHPRTLLTVAGVADRLGVSQPTVRRHVRAGSFPA
jgi:excisionase family DNA binding protein